jgi:RHS repeat-associated protein
MVASPNNGGFYDTGYTTTSPEMRFLVDIRQPGTYYVWIRAWADSGTDDSAHIGLDDQATASADKIYPNTLGAWVWTKLTMDGPYIATLNVTTPGVHVVNIWAREDGLYIDKIVLTTNGSYIPSGTGPAESVRGPVYVYDGDGNRVKAVEGGKTTAYLGSHYEVEVSGGITTTRSYYYAGALRVAMRVNSDLHYLLGDHLGSTSVSYKADGSDTDTQTYKAWGELRWPETSTLPTDRTYTGQHSEMEGIGLLFYGARWYDPALSRWAQPDTIIPNPFNPLDWDRFAYVRSNSLRYIDPTGHWSQKYLTTDADFVGASLYGIRFVGDWYLDDMLAHTAAAQLEGARLAVGGQNPAIAFRSHHNINHLHPLSLKWNDNC